MASKESQPSGYSGESITNPKQKLLVKKSATSPQHTPERHFHSSKPGQNPKATRHSKIDSHGAKHILRARKDVHFKDQYYNPNVAYDLLGQLVDVAMGHNYDQLLSSGSGQIVVGMPYDLLGLSASEFSTARHYDPEIRIEDFYLDEEQGGQHNGALVDIQGALAVFQFEDHHQPVQETGLSVVQLEVSEMQDETQEAAATPSPGSLLCDGWA